MADARAGTAARPALIAFGDRWELDGDYLRCRCCGRPQIASCALMDFPHAAGCRHDAEAERQPWISLAGLVNAQIAGAAHVEDVSDEAPQTAAPSAEFTWADHARRIDARSVGMTHLQGVAAMDLPQAAWDRIARLIEREVAMGLASPDGAREVWRRNVNGT